MEITIVISALVGILNHWLPTTTPIRFVLSTYLQLRQITMDSTPYYVYDSSSSKVRAI